MLEVSLSRHTCAAHVVLNDEYGNAFVFWYHNGTKHTTSRENHMVAFFPNTDKSFTLEMNELGPNKCLITARTRIL
ncbi:MAG: hypothetical protein QOH41_2288 [Blastocatellia bacterium]|jgi:hypothetical protein|nr:hypothetical protein [Blastocatellia bacterium]